MPHAERGAAIYATVPAGPLLPAFIAAIERSGFGYLVWVKQSSCWVAATIITAHEPILCGWREDGPHFFTEDRSQGSVFEVDRPMVSELHPTTSSASTTSAPAIAAARSSAARVPTTFVSARAAGVMPNCFAY